jgi:hypothetical protein
MPANPPVCERRIERLVCVFTKSCASKYCCHDAAFVCISGVPPREQRKLYCPKCATGYSRKYGVEMPT